MWIRNQMKIPCKIKLSCCWHKRACFVDYGVYIQKKRNAHSNKTIDNSFVISITFLSTRSDLIQECFRSYNTLSLVTQENIMHLDTYDNYFSSQQTHVNHELIVFCITGWIESEPSHPFSSPTDNWTWTWFCTHICRHETIIFIFWNKKTICQIVLV